MTTSIQKAYDAVAVEYADTFANELSGKPLDRELLARFAELARGVEPIWDLGCGPGQTTAYLAAHGAKVHGLDRSHPMLAPARRRHPGIPFVQSDMLSLPLAAESLAGVVAFYAIVHVSRAELAQALREMARVLREGGLGLLAFHIGDETIHVDEFLGKRVSLDFVFFPTDQVVTAIQTAGMAVEEVVEREPYAEVEYQSRRAYLLFRKPSAPCSS